MFFPICSIDVFCFSLACFLLKVSEIFSCINFIDFPHCRQAFEGDAGLTCTACAKQKKASSRVSGKNGDPAFERPRLNCILWEIYPWAVVAEHLRRPVIDDMVITNMIKSSHDLHLPPWPFPVSAKLWSRDHHWCTQRDCVCVEGGMGELWLIWLATWCWLSSLIAADE